MADEAKRLLTPPALLCFPHVFKPQIDAKHPEKKPKYNCSLVFDKAAQQTPEFAALRSEIKRLALGAFGKDGKLPASVRNPLRDGSEKGYKGYGPGTLFCSVSTTVAPQVVGQNLRPITEEDLYPGCYVVASVQPFTYNTDGNKGVSLGLRNIKKVAEGERLGGGSTAAQDFGAPADEAPSEFTGSAAPSPKAGGTGSFAAQMAEATCLSDDEIPF